MWELDYKESPSTEADVTKSRTRLRDWTELKVKVKPISHVRLFATTWTVAYQAPPSMGFSRQEYWSGLPFPSPGDLPNPGIEPGSHALQADTLPSTELIFIYHLNAFFSVITLCIFFFFQYLTFLSLSMARLKISLCKCHIAIENKCVILNYLLILISNVIPQW